MDGLATKPGKGEKVINKYQSGKPDGHCQRVFPASASRRRLPQALDKNNLKKEF